MVSRSSTALVAQVLVPLWWLLVQMIGFVWQNRKKSSRLWQTLQLTAKVWKWFARVGNFQNQLPLGPKILLWIFFCEKVEETLLLWYFFCISGKKIFSIQNFWKKSFSMLQRYIIIFWKVQKYFYWIKTQASFFSNDSRNVQDWRPWLS